MSKKTTLKLVGFVAAVLVFLVVVGPERATASAWPLGQAGRGEPVGEVRHFLVQLWIGQNQALVNGESKTLDVPPMLYNDRTMVPLRFVAESLGVDVQWDPAEQKIMLADGWGAPSEKTQFDVILKIGQNHASVNGELKTLDVPPMLHKDRTMVPLRFIAEALGADVQWDPAEQCVTITLRLMPLDAFINVTTKDFRATMKAVMHEAAQQAKIQLDEAEPVVIVSKESQLAKPNLLIVNTAVQGANTLTIEQLEKGADVLFTFLQLPEGSELSSGLYVIRISGDAKASNWVAQFKSTDGRVVLEKPAELKKGLSAPDGKVTVTAGISFADQTVTLDIHWSSASIQTAFRLGNVDSDTTALAGEKSAVQDSKKALDAFINATTKALTQAAEKYGKSVLDGWMSLSRGDDFLVAHTVIQDMNGIIIEELAKGQDVFFGYFRTPEGSGLPDGFYRVCVIQESGRWLGRFVNDKDEIVLEGPAEVTDDEYTAKARPKGEFTGGINSDSATIGYRWTDSNGREHSIKTIIPLSTKKGEPVSGAEVIVNYIPQASENTQFHLFLNPIRCKTSEKGEFAFSFPEEQFKKLPDEFSVQITIVPPKGWTGISSSNVVTVKVKKIDGPKFEFVLLWQEEGDIKSNKGTFAVSAKAQT